MNRKKSYVNEVICLSDYEVHTMIFWLIIACYVQLRTTITIDEPAPGLKAIFSFIVPDQRSGKVRIIVSISWRIS